MSLHLSTTSQRSVSNPINSRPPATRFRLLSLSSLHPFDNHHSPSRLNLPVLKTARTYPHQILTHLNHLSFPSTSPFDSASFLLFFFFFSQLSHSSLTHTDDDFKSYHPQRNPQSFFSLRRYLLNCSLGFCQFGEKIY
ncbi:hypothetical protein PGT21_023033 [Puccinia graminis f. sp. tritici]|uniref:Uncharacterized protein n=1 Tax=Puccinia graminis f. sp. tritici TaxID=56615 RepID=A0A5B0P360_PUCGR|nr:hypothetical protein PGT21_023033 [Puccinia graminis f. sp. tritici]